MGDETPSRPRSRSANSALFRVTEAAHLGLAPAQIRLAESLKAEIPALAAMSRKFAGATPKKNHN